ncbi:hypothetical protein [Micromonospora sp. NPDC093277]|uniref:hypothetical protein n=1 Tax=Micromonospora sp. NPDC093277 TaxID=3364291 RepID=UPI003814F5D9
MPSDQHLQMIQSVITRMANQSSTIKGWMITIVAALLSFGAASKRAGVIALAFYVVAAMGLLDSYYLAIERKYRALYRRAATGQTEHWIMDIENPGLKDIASAIKSPATCILYSATFILIFGALYLV